MHELSYLPHIQALGSEQLLDAMQLMLGWQVLPNRNELLEVDYRTVSMHYRPQLAATLLAVQTCGCRIVATPILVSGTSRP